MVASVSFVSRGTINIEFPSTRTNRPSLTIIGTTIDRVAKTPSLPHSTGKVFFCTGKVFFCTGKVFFCTRKVFFCTGKVFFCTGKVFVKTERRTSEVCAKKQKANTSHTDRANEVNKAFIIWLLVHFHLCF